jgi:tetratricopeptide (TPR) repeat protein
MKKRINVIFALIVAGLLVTAIWFMSINSEPTLRRSSPEVSSSQLPANHPPIGNEAFEKSLSSLEQMSSKDPQNPDYPTQIANIYYDAGDYGKAIEYYQRSLDLRPRDPNVETDLATCFHYLGQHDKALEILNKVLEYSPGFPQALFNKGIVLVSGKNDVRSGIEVWQDLLRLNPDFPKRAEVEQRIKQLKASTR